jgi:hypothetical protein
VYEAPPKIVSYDEDSLEKKVAYSYGQPSDVMNDEWSYRFNAFGEKAVDILSKLAGNETSLKKSTKDSGDTENKDDGEVVENFATTPTSSSCGTSEDGTNICGGTNLFPIMDPRFNLREAAKNMILLEDHLFHYGKRCHDCILKHCLTVEGFLEEGITLDKKREYTDIINKSLTSFRGIFKDLAEKIQKRSLQDDECCEFAQRIREIRKPLCQKFATFIQ